MRLAHTGRWRFARDDASIAVVAFQVSGLMAHVLGFDDFAGVIFMRE